jgi:hypothetical protein
MISDMNKVAYEMRVPITKPTKDSKGLALPGFPNATLVSVHCLMQKYSWSETDIDWLDKNWIKLAKTEFGKAIYAKPGSSFDDQNLALHDQHLVYRE